MGALRERGRQTEAEQGSDPMNVNRSFASAPSASAGPGPPFLRPAWLPDRTQRGGSPPACPPRRTTTTKSSRSSRARLSAKMDKTVVVRVTRTVAHPKYGKRFQKSKNFYAHDE